MTKTVGIVLGVYGIIAFAVGLITLVMRLEDGLPPYQSFVTAIWSGLGWPVSLVALIWG